MDHIQIEGIELEAIVGLRARERTHKQLVRIDLSLGLDLARAARTGRIAETCDYDRVTDEIAALVRFRRYRLLEVAAEEVAAMLLGVHQAAQEVALRLAKPEALHGRARSAAVAITRSKSSFPRTRHEVSFGVVEELLHSAEARLSLIHLHPGRAIEPIAKDCWLGWVVSGTIRTEGSVLGAGDALPIASLLQAPAPPPPEEGQDQLGFQGPTLFCCVLSTDRAHNEPHSGEDALVVGQPFRAR